MLESLVEMLIKKASQDEGYGQLTRANHCSSNSIQASTVTHPFEDELLPRTKSLPTARNNLVSTRSSVAPAPRQDHDQSRAPPPPQQDQVPSNATRRCVIL